ncbi:hypothetical protein RIVM261_071700 [Rivularia sp. IAM M-261]|nr:hypothetical protein CAL7716_019710 [Calothrix sp. PCC 7716]GJD22214.1 hypothetical protein RIVM261_071700 [Rivularia sp. IAM M-261]
MVNYKEQAESVKRLIDRFAKVEFQDRKVLVPLRCVRETRFITETGFHQFNQIQLLAFAIR